MNNGIYSTLAGLVARTQDFEIVSNNLANVSSPGYRAQRSFFETLAMESPDDSEATAIPGQFAAIGGAYVDGRSGHIETTGNTLDLALEGPGYFAVQTPQGLRYTRNGQFHLDAEHRLVTSSGDAVLGDSGPIELPPGPVAISAAGMISTQGAIAGQLQIVEFAAGTKLQPEGASYLASENGGASPATNTTIQQGAIEASNISPVEGAVAMVTLQRQTELLERSLMIFHSEFNRIAAEELPKAL